MTNPDAADDRRPLPGGPATDYLRRNWALVAVSVFLVVLTFGYEIFGFTLSMDEELKTYTHTATAWVAQGRWTTYLITRLVLPNSMIPFLPTFLAAVFLVIACLLACEFIGGDLVSKSVFSAWFITFPTNAHFMEFGTFNTSVSVGLAMAAGALLLLKLHAASRGGWLHLAGAAVLIALSLGTYQSMSCVVPCLVLIYCLTSIAAEPVVDWRRVARFVVLSLTTFFVGAMLYKAVDYGAKHLLAADGDTYLDHFVGWGNPGAWDRVLDYVESHLRGNGMYGGRTATVIAIVCPAFLLVQAWHAQLGRAAVTLVGLVLLVASPFAMALLVGGPLPLRSLVAFPAMLGGACFLLCAHTGRFVRIGILALTGVCALHNAFVTTRLFYSDHVARDSDRMLVSRIAERIDHVVAAGASARPLPVAFVGMIANDGNDAIVKSEVFGASYFEFFGPSQDRIHAFMKLSGVRDMRPPTRVEMVAAMAASRSMPEWPSAGCVALRDGVVVVKMSAPTPMQLAGTAN